MGSIPSAQFPPSWLISWGCQQGALCTCSELARSETHWNGSACLGPALVLTARGWDDSSCFLPGDKPIAFTHPRNPPWMEATSWAEDPESDGAVGSNLPNITASMPFIPGAEKEIKESSQIQIKRKLRYDLTPVVTAIRNNRKQQVWVKMQRKGNPLALLMDVKTCVAPLENSFEATQNVKNRNTLIQQLPF